MHLACPITPKTLFGSDSTLSFPNPLGLEKQVQDLDSILVSRKTEKVEKLIPKVPLKDAAT